ncbi:hypothetical protein PM082_006562 [Marasmius tenuissimus]|nr:hypothetical protein PM082_006562 [Marasmius tenuissimus]
MSCPDCFKGSILAGEPVGAISSIEGAYLSPAPEDSEDSEKAVVLLTDIFGLPLNNPKVIADSLAKRLGCDVWVPDLFAGKPPFEVEKMSYQPPERAGEKFSQFKFIMSVLPSLPKLLKNRASVVDKRLTKFFEKLRQERPHYKKIGAVGYCFGGATAVRFGKTDYVHSIVVCHPGPFSDKDLKAVKVPCSWVCAEDDFTFPKAKREKAEAEFAKRKDPSHQYQFEVYKGTTHGFACRPNMEYPEVKEGFEGAMDQTVEWFKKTLDTETISPESQPARASSMLAPATERATEDSPAQETAEATQNVAAVPVTVAA